MHRPRSRRPRRSLHRADPLTLTRALKRAARRRSRQAARPAVTSRCLPRRRPSRPLWPKLPPWQSRLRSSKGPIPPRWLHPALHLALRSSGWSCARPRSPRWIRARPARVTTPSPSGSPSVSSWHSSSCVSAAARTYAPAQASRPRPATCTRLSKVVTSPSRPAPSCARWAPPFDSSSPTSTSP